MGEEAKANHVNEASKSARYIQPGINGIRAAERYELV